MLKRMLICGLLLVLAGCTFGFDPNATLPPGAVVVGGSGSGTNVGDTGTVTRVVDGDTINVDINGTVFSVRYIGVNTPETTEPCYKAATDANRLLVEGKTVRLVKDVSEADRYGRLLRYVYVGDLFVNGALVQQGFAEAAAYPPDTAQESYFEQLEAEAKAANRGCHPTGIFNDGSTTR
jgi:micrococcal nuclease